jgi:FkbM family methyltransferase
VKNKGDLMKQSLVKVVRKVTSSFLFKKTLPPDFNREKIIVSSRSDIRLLAPGLEQAAGDLFTVVRKYVSPNDVVWDIGSNLGIFTFCSAIKTQRNGSVFSLEADSRYADIQSQTLKTFSEEAGTVSILCAAVADQLGILELLIPKKGHARNHLKVVTGNSAGETDMSKQVVTVTLDWLLQYWSPPNLIKIDVEGAELLAVTGGEKLFSECRPTGYIECSPENSEALTDFFKSHDYLLFSLNVHGEEQPIQRFAFNTIVKPKEQCK